MGEPLRRRASRSSWRRSRGSNRGHRSPRSDRGRHVFTERRGDGKSDLQAQGRAMGGRCEAGRRQRRRAAGGRAHQHADGDPAHARCTSLRVNPRMLVFGEDVGPKGGVHAATLGLQETLRRGSRLRHQPVRGRHHRPRRRHGARRPACRCPRSSSASTPSRRPEQLNDCGTMRWRTVNRFAAPMVVRMPGGFFKCGDPWHSQCNEVAVGCTASAGSVAMPSNAEDAVGPAAHRRCAATIR